MAKDNEDTKADDRRVAVNFNINELAQWQAAMLQAGNIDPKLPFALVPAGDDGMKVLDLENLMPTPRMIQRAPNFLQTDDFIRYVGEYSEGVFPALFYTQDDSGFSALCILDYDVPPVSASIQAEGMEPQDYTKLAEPRWGRHAPTLTLSWDLDYATWRKSDGQWFSQQDFALFVEANLHVFRSPTGADMMELAQELRGTRNATWQSGDRLADGARSLEYVEEINAKSKKGDVSVPAHLMLEMPIYRGMTPSDIKAAFSWRLVNDKVEFSYRLMSKIQERDAQEAIRQRLGDELRIMPLMVSSLSTALRK